MHMKNNPSVIRVPESLGQISSKYKPVIFNEIIKLQNNNNNIIIIIILLLLNPSRYSTTDVYVKLNSGQP